MTRLWRDAWRNVVRRARRNALSITAVATGAAAIVVMVGFVHSSAERVASQIDAYEESSIVVTLPSDTWGIPESELVRRAGDAGPIAAAGTVSVTEASTAAIDLEAPRGSTTARAGLVVASAEGLVARGATVVDGFLPTSFPTSDPYVVALGVALARELEVDAREGSNIIYMGAQPLTVTGIVRDEVGGATLDTTVIVTPETAEHLGVTARVSRVMVIVADANAAAIAEGLPYTLLPDRPESVTVALPPSPEALRAKLVGDSELMIVVVVIVMAVASALGIISTMQIAIWERRREIGLDRALGAQREHIVRTFLLEAVLIGTSGALLGSIVGVVVLAGVVSAAGWLLVMPMQVVCIPLAGAIVGGLSGAIPAAYASRVDPLELLRA